MGLRRYLISLLFFIALSLLAFSQADLATVPRMVKYTGSAPAGATSASFAIYATQDGLAPLWLETQSISLDDTGHYTVLLGSTKPDGLPAGIFASNEARWIGVKIGDAPESSRTLLVSVPYALKAGDAETLGGKPLSAFLLANASSGGKNNEASRSNPDPQGTGDNGSTNFVAKFSSTGSGAAEVNSQIFDDGTHVGVGTTSPGAKLDVNGNINIPVTTTSTSGVISLGGNPFLHAFGSLNAFMGQGAGNFSLTGNLDTATGFASLSADTNGSGNTANGAFSLFVNTTGTLNTAIGVNSLPNNTTGTGNTAVGGLAGLTSTSANANVSGSNNTFLGYQSGPGTATQLNNATAIGANALVSQSNSIVLGDGTVNVGIGTQAPTQALDVNGTVNATTFTGSGSGLTNITANSATLLNFPSTTDSTHGVLDINGTPFLHAAGNSNTFLGSSAGNFTLTGAGNVAVGFQTLQNDTTGLGNTAIGFKALQVNITGSANTALGDGAMISNTTGFNNTASGATSLPANTTGSENTADGLGALFSNTTGNQNTGSGRSALGLNTSGSDNVAVGYSAGQTGTGANANTTGSFNTFMGYRAGPGTPTQLTNATAIGANALVSQSNSLVLGDGTINVGIGTSSPSSTMHVQGTSNTYLTVGSSGANNLDRGLRFLDQAGTPAAYMIATPNTTGTNSALNFYVGGATGNDIRLSINNNGNVGYGTLNPSSPLHVKGTGTNYIIVDSSGTNDLDRGMRFMNQSGVSAGLIALTPNTIGVDSKMLFYVGGAALSDVKLSLFNNGNVGIGTPSPMSPLHVKGSGPTYMILDSSAGNTSDRGIEFLNQAGSPAGYITLTPNTIGTDANMKFYVGGGSGSDVKMTVLNNGNVGIGNSNPAANLDVTGNIHTTGTIFFNDGSPQSTAGVTAVVANQGLTSTVVQPGNHLSVGLQTCANGQVLQSTGTAWACTTPAAGSGGLTLPFAATTATTSPNAGFAVTQTSAVLLQNDPTFSSAMNSIPAGIVGVTSTTSATNSAVGVAGFATGPQSIAVIGWNGATNATGGNGSHSTGVLGRTDDPQGTAIEAENSATTGNGVGIEVDVESPTGTGIAVNVANGGRAGLFNGGVTVNGGLQVGGVITNPNGPLAVNSSVNFASNINAPAATIANISTANISPSGTGTVFVAGNLTVAGTISKGSGTFEIDHPLDPTGKYLYHSFVESPDMMNMYNGIVTLDAKGHAVIAMPDYFEALNMDFRYQLTAMGASMPGLYVAKEVAGNRFEIAGGKPHARVSWQVTGIRHDAYANAHRVQVEVEKPVAEQGTYLHPELFTKEGKEKLASADNHK